MSHSQFHSIDLFILRHAWLNLWDKRMLLAESTRLLIFVPLLTLLIILLRSLVENFGSYNGRWAQQYMSLTLVSSLYFILSTPAISTQNRIDTCHKQSDPFTLSDRFSRTIHMRILKWHFTTSISLDMISSACVKLFDAFNTFVWLVGVSCNSLCAHLI